MRVAKRVKNEQDQWVTDGHLDLPEEWDGVLDPGTRAVSEAEVSVISNAVEEFGSIEKVIEKFHVREGSTIPWCVQTIMKARKQERHAKMVGEAATGDQDRFFDDLFARLTVAHREQFASESPRAWLRIQQVITNPDADRADVSMAIDAIREFNRKHGLGRSGDDDTVDEADGDSDVLDVKDGEQPF